MLISRIATRLAALAVVLAMTGCASFEFTKPAPAQKQPIALKSSGEELSGWTDLPLGVYRIPESHVILSGHQKGTAASMLFGVIGVAVVHAANAGAGADGVKDAETKLRIKLDRQVDNSIAQILANDQYKGTFTSATLPGGTRMLVTPALVLSYVNELDIRPFVVLKASLMGSDTKPIWTTRYIASTSKARPLFGDDGWLSKDADPLKRAVQENIDVAMRTLATDVTRPYARDENRMTLVQGNFPYVKQRLQVVGYPLVEDDKYLTFVPKLGDILVFTGVNIIDKASIVNRPATKDDAPLKLLD